MNKELILRGMIEIYQNDFSAGYKGEDKEKLRVLFLELIVEVTRYVHDFRYCNIPECSCSPESKIRKIVENHQEELKTIFGGFSALTDVSLSYIRKFLYSFVKEVD